MIPIDNKDGTVTIPLEMYQGLISHYGQSFFSPSHFLYYLEMEDLPLTEVSKLTGINEAALTRITRLNKKPSLRILDALNEKLSISQFLYPMPTFHSDDQSLLNKELLMSLVREESNETKVRFKRQFNICPNGVPKNIPDNPSPRRIFEIAEFLSIDVAVLINVPLPTSFNRLDISFKKKYKKNNIFKDFLIHKGYHRPQELQRATGITSERINNWIQQGYQPRLNNHLKIIEHFQLPFDFFF